MIALIIADSFKRGMKSQGCAGLLKYSNKEILLQQQYRVLKSVFPRCKIVYVYGFDSKKLKEIIGTKHKNIHSIYNAEYSLYNHGYSLYKASSLIRAHNKCLVVPGYDPIDKGVLMKLKHTNASSVALIDKPEPKLGCVFDHQTGKVHHIFYDLHNQISDTYMIHEDEINILSQLLDDPITHNRFLFEIMNDIINNNGQIYAVK
jgi:CTP:phosphocholine cytidylyltransferase-like protein